MAPDLVGRGEEIAAGRKFLADSATGPACIVFEGETGIGKTVLWQRLVDEALVQDRRVLVSRPAESEAELSFASLTDLLAPVIEEVRPSLPVPQREALDVALLRATPTGEHDVRALGTALLTALRWLSARGPVVIAVDDVQWMDPATTRALEFAMRRIEADPVGLLLTRRSGGDPGPTVEAWLPSAHVDVRRLEPMSSGALHRLVELKLGISLARPALLHLERVSHGNPLLALDIVDAVRRTGRELTPEAMLPIPTDVQQLVERRVGALPEATRRLLADLAVIGRRDRGMLATLREARRPIGDALQPALDAGLVVELGDQVDFAHPLYRSAVYAGTAEAQRRKLHLRLAAIAVDPEEAARHLAAGTNGTDPAAAETLERVAGDARFRGALETAIVLFGHAIRLTPADAVAAKARRMVTLARVLWDVGDLPRSRALLDEVLGSDVAGPMLVAALVLDGLHRQWSVGAEASIESFTAALPHAAGHPVHEAIVHLRIAYASDNDLAAVQRHAHAAVALLDGRVGSEDLLASALLLSAEARFLAAGAYDGAAVERGRALLRADPSPRDPLISFDGRGVARERSWLLRELTDELAAARDELEALHRDDRELGRDRSATIAHADLAEICCWLGDVAGARAHAELAQEIVRQTGGTPFAVAASLLASALVAEHTGDLKLAVRAGKQALERADRLGPSPLTDLIQVLLGRAALQGGRPSAAVERFAAVEERLLRAGVRHPLVYRFRGDHLEALVLAGRLDEARAALSTFEEAAARHPTPWSTTVAARSRALLAATAGDVGAAVEELEAALEQDGVALPVERGRTELLLGRLRRRQRQKRRAAEALERAAGTFEAAGAMGWAANARRDLDRLGRRTGGADELTVTEREVAQLAAGGMTNRQVADALVLSPKTIDGTLSRVYGKLGIHTRAELGALLGRTSPPE